MEFSRKEMHPKACLPLEDNDAKYVSGLSTVLVATIQEAKDRISQIEYIFCSQLYPNVQKSTKCLQKLYSEARRAAEDEWKERVNELELRVEQLRVEKDQACESSKAEKSRLVGKIADLEEKLLQKAKEIDDGMVLHGKLLGLIESKTSLIADKEKQMKEHEERTSVRMSRFEELEGNIVTLEKELQEKNEEVAKGKELRAELLKQIESQAVKTTSSELMLADFRKENKKLAVEFGDMEISFLRLKNELKGKSVEVEEGNKLREQLIQQANLNGVELTRRDQQLSVCEGERNRLLSRINDLENEVEVLQENLKKGMDRKHETCEHHDLAQQIEGKNLELVSEKQKSRDLLAAYKRLKSQHNFLLLKCGLTSEESLREMKVEGGSNPSNQDNRSLSPPELKRKNPASNMVPSELNTVKKETNSMESSDGEKGIRSNHVRNSNSPSTSNASPWTTKANIGSSAGTKRPAPGWRETRSRPSPGGPDPHDDFLDTPYENIRGNLRKSMNENMQENPPQVSKDMGPNSSDDDDDDATQDMEAQSSSRKQHFQVSEIGGTKGFKYLEPVRKKADRENLNGVECKQCKKFYDAVLCDAKGRDGEVDKRDLRCEHHEGVSRHRYRYAPPMTPEGFWNIGFDTES